jgi:hypothetical protein
VLLGYIVLSGLLGGFFYLINASWLPGSFAGLLLALLMGFEAATLWRWTLARGGWRTVGFAIGDDEESAERRFFAEWTRRTGKQSPPPASQPQLTTPVRRGPPSGSDVIGLFPEPRP